MGFLNIFSGKDPQEIEKKGDRLFKAGAYGEAKLQYEEALYKLEKKGPDNLKLKGRFAEKIRSSKEALAFQHKQRGKEYLESQCDEDAADAFSLALELTEDPELKNELRSLLQKTQIPLTADELTEIYQDTSDEEIVVDVPLIDEDEYFAVLCGAFSDKGREKAYKSYGEAFREGYLALNQGNFSLAASKLSEAMAENRSDKSYIPLELATALLNLEKTQEAAGLLIGFLEDYPESFQAHMLLCEIYWETNAFDQAHQLLQACPKQISASPQIQFLRGETFFQAQRFQEAKAVFSDFLKTSPWDENIALSLAKTYEALGEREQALSLYGTVMNQCGTCGKSVSPYIKQRYAEISLECGKLSTEVLELYLSLIQEDPDHRADYYQRIIELYSALGNEDEARRIQKILQPEIGEEKE